MEIIACNLLTTRSASNGPLDHRRYLKNTYILERRQIFSNHPLSTKQRGFHVLRWHVRSSLMMHRGSPPSLSIRINCCAWIIGNQQSVLSV